MVLTDVPILILTELAGLIPSDEHFLWVKNIGLVIDSSVG